MNVELLTQIRDAILARPQTMDMHAFFEGTIGSAGKTYGRPGCGIKVLKRELLKNCGTTACIAGWALALTETRVSHGYSTNKIQRLAAQVLDIESTPESLQSMSGRLFYLYEWPAQFAGKYRRARTAQGRARVVAERIDAFIKSEGKI